MSVYDLVGVDHGSSFQMLQAYFRLHGIEVPDQDGELFHHLSQNRFLLIHEHPLNWQEGDVVLSAIQSSTADFASIWLDRNNILYQPSDGPAVLTTYNGTIKNTTIGVLRHRDLKIEYEEAQKDITEFLPPHVKARLARLAQERRIEGEGGLRPATEQDGGGREHLP